MEMGKLTHNSGLPDAESRTSNFAKNGFRTAGFTSQIVHILWYCICYLCRADRCMKNTLLFISMGLLLSSCSLFKKTAKAPAVQPASTSISTPPPQKERTVRKAAVEDEKPEAIPQPGNDVTNIPVISPEMFYELQFKYAILLDIPVEEMMDHELIRFMEHWYGTHYRMGGVDTNGIDCSGFTIQYMRYFHQIDLPRTSRDQYAQATRVDKQALKEGDLVFFRTGRKKVISHVGVYLRNNKFAHASTSSGVMISDLDEPYYHARFVGAGRYY